MQEWPYAKEPFDTKLFVFLLIKKIWLLLCAAVAGAVLIGGGYYLKKVMFAGPQEYEITTTYYVEYNCFDPVTGQMHNYTNAATWGNWVVSDYFVDKTWEYALEAGLVPEQYGIKKSDLKSYFTADLPSDLRIPTSTVTTPDEELTIVLNKALQKSYIDFGVERTEMDSISITNETPVAVADRDVRTLRACILGAVIGLFVATFGAAMMIIWDDSIYLPDSFSYRYGIPMAGYADKTAKGFTKEAAANLQYLFQNKEKKAILIVGKQDGIQPVLQMLKRDGFSEVISVNELDTTTYKKLRDAQGILLLVEAAAHNGREIEHVLHEMKLQDCLINGALLYNANSRMICCLSGRKYNLANR